ncbi:MAG: hypothetical protein D6768_19315 [Chloroflexi bacterium]|nr:MAG: hypothetical protein D6768_19315 [Chloroflexota bacterium]
MLQLPVIPPNAITTRDRALFQWLAAVKLASESQLHRYFWPDSTIQAARRRLRQLEKYSLLARVTLPEKTLKADYLPGSSGYRLSKAGRLWLRQVAGMHPGYEPKRLQYHHELLVAEVSTRFFEMARRRGWRAEWYGEAAIAYIPDPDNPPKLLPDGLSVIRDAGGKVLHTFFIEVDASRESHGKRRSQIGQKITEYDRMFKQRLKQPLLSQLPRFPAVLFLTGAEKRLQNLAAAIQEYRREPVGYALTRLETLLTATTPILETRTWFLLPADHSPPLGDSPLAREPLINAAWQTNMRIKRPKAQSVRPKPVVPPAAHPATPLALSVPATQSVAQPPPAAPASGPVSAPAAPPSPGVTLPDQSSQELPLFPFGWLAKWRQWLPWLMFAMFLWGVLVGES